MDLKSHFDTVDMDILWKIMEKYSLGVKVILRIKEVYKETAIKIRVDEKSSNIFWTKDLGRDALFYVIESTQCRKI